MTPLTTVIREIHLSGHAYVLAITGGGSSAIGELLQVPGGSASMLEAIVPYAERSLHEWLRGKPDQACSRETARAMAMAAWLRARELAPETMSVQNLVGLGCTASLASDRPKRGSHRVHLACQTLSATRTLSLELTKGARPRSEEESLVTALLIDLLAEVTGVGPRPPLELLPGEEPQSTLTVAPQPWQDLLLGTRNCVAGPDTNPSEHAQAIFPGAFHPLHAGHRTMARLATERLGVPVAFEISIENVDKPPLDYTAWDERLQQFQGASPVWLTRAPTFVRKSAVFPGATFIVGADTLVRVGQPKYYGDEAARDEALADIATRGCRFLVFGRAADNRFRTIDELELPPALRTLCDQIPEAEFRHDISSTELRHQIEQAQQ